VNAAGGASLVERDNQADKIIFTALSDCDNRNAFQQNLGLGAGMIFDVESPILRAKILRLIVNVFRDFESLEFYKLLLDTVEFSSDGDAGDLFLEFKYLNLESDDIVEFRRSVKDLGG